MGYKIAWTAQDLTTWFLVILSFLWPFSFLLLPYRQEVLNNNNKAETSIQEAIETKSIEKLESLMCENIKKNDKALQEEIETLFKSIQGTIESF